MGAWILAAAFAPTAAADLLGVQSGPFGNLVWVSPADGTTTVIGPTGSNRAFAGLATRPSDGQVFGLTVGAEPFAAFGPPALYRIDPWTAATTLVGALSSPSNDFLFEGGLAISPDGIGYGLYYTTTFQSGDPFYLVRIDLDTAAFDVVGAVTPIGINGLAFRSDGALVGFDDVTDTLVRIDVGTGVTTTIGSLGIDARVVGGLAVLNGTGYLVEGEAGASSLYTVDLFTGATTFVGPITAPGAVGLSGLTEVVPEPGTLVLVSAVAAAVLWRRRRRR
jgi:hypothetical protein